MSRRIVRLILATLVVALVPPVGASPAQVTPVAAGGDHSLALMSGGNDGERVPGRLSSLQYGVDLAVVKNGPGPMEPGLRA